jgi:hypothetical protein
MQETATLPLSNGLRDENTPDVDSPWPDFTDYAL